MKKLITLLILAFSVSAFAVPGTPTASAASSITKSSFNANWGAVTATPVVTGYYIDVSTVSNFASFVTGYSNLLVTGQATVTKSITGLTPNTTYYYRVRAYDGTNTSASSSPNITVTTLTTPTATVVTNLATTSFSANWGAVPSATDYKIDVSTNSGFTAILGSYNNISTGAVTTTSITGLSVFTTYYYRVRAIVGGVTSANSNTITIVTSPAGSGTVGDPYLISTFAHLQWVSSNNVVLSGFSGKYIKLTANIDAAGSNWTPIGNYFNRFVGNFDGNNKVISNMTITLTAANNTGTGLFGWIDTGVVIKNTGVSNYSISCNADGVFTYIGGFAGGIEAGTIDDCYAIGTISITGFTTRTISSIGGFVGASGVFASPGGTITNCYARPSITITETATGTVNYVSSFVGYKKIGTLTNCYSTGTAAITATTKSNNAGFAGLSAGVAYSNCYSSDGSSLGLAANVTAKTTAELQAAGMPALLGNNHWVVDASTPINGSFPVLAWQRGLPLAPTIGTATSGDASASVAFTAPTNNGGASISGYTVTSNPGSITATGASSPITVTGLASNTAYTFTVTATNANGTSASSAASNSVTIAAATPTASAATNVASTSFDANWSAAAGATGYYIDVATDTGFSSLVGVYTNLSVGNVVTSSITGLTANTTYYYRVRATNGTVGANSNTITGTTLPAAPTSTTASSITATGFTTNWTAPSPAGTAAYTYTVEYGTVSDLSSGTTLVSGIASGTLLNAITGLTANTNYYYRVKAVNTTGVGAWSSSIQSVTTLPAAPTVSAASAVTATTFTANWVAGSGNGALNYYIDVATDAAFTSVLTDYNNLLVTLANSTSVTGLTPNTNYYFRVRAINTSGTSGNTGFTTVGTTSTIVVLTNTSVATLPVCPTCDVTVAAGAELTVGTSRTYTTITVAPTGKLTINDQSTLTAAVALQSNAIGNATFTDANVTPLSVTGTVEQYLPQGRNWYLSSPVTAATGNTSSLLVAGAATSVSYYNEATSAWVMNYTGALTPGVGYVAASSTGSGTNNITFTGALNTGDVVVALTLKGTEKVGFNLVANPYPSYLDAMAAINANANVIPSIWYRTCSVAGVYYFETVNTTSGVGTDDAGTGTVTGWLPPMQAFWVRSNVDDQTITFTNAMRKHAGNVPLITGGTVATTPMKVKATSTSVLIRLQLSNGISNNETILYSNAGASNNLDAYDSPKMWNTSAVSELYTVAGTEALVINGMNAIPLDVEIPLGLTTESSSTLSLKATELTNLEPGVKVILKDNLYPAEFDLTNGAVFNFTSDAVATTDRFSLILKCNSSPNGFQTVTNLNVLAYGNKQQQIVVQLNNVHANTALLTINNVLGQKIIEKQISTSVKQTTKSMIPGMYMVSLTVNGVKATRKVVIK